MILVDSCVLIDVVDKDPQWHEWSMQVLGAHQSRGLTINAVIYAEIAPSFESPAQLQAMLTQADIAYSDIGHVAAWQAALAYQHYRVNKGVQKMILPDFFIGAQAQACGWPVLTRDKSRFRTYFPTLSLITPDTA